MKATAVQAKPVKLEEVATQACCECHRPLKAPWGRVDGGKKWVCSKHCNDLFSYSERHLVAINHKPTAG